MHCLNGAARALARARRHSLGDIPFASIPSFERLRQAKPPAPPLQPQEPGFARRKSLTVTTHPTMDPAVPEGFRKAQQAGGQCPAGESWRPGELAWSEMSPRLRKFVAASPDARVPPAAGPELDNAIGALEAMIWAEYAAVRKGSREFEGMGRSRLWAGRDWDGQEPGPGALTRITCLQISRICGLYAAALRESGGPSEAVGLLDTASAAARELSWHAEDGLPAAEVMDRLVPHLDVDALQARVCALIARGHPLLAIIEKHGMAGADGEMRFNAARLGHCEAVLEEAAAIRPLRPFTSVVGADFTDQAHIDRLRRALDWHGFEACRVMPLLETRAAVEKYLRGELRGTSHWMIAGSDLPREVGSHLAFLLAMRFLAAARARDHVTKIGRGNGPYRQGEGNSESFGRLIHAGVDGKGHVGPSADEYTVQGAAFAVQMLASDGFASRARRYVPPADAPRFEVTSADIDCVESALRPFILSDLDDRKAHSVFAKVHGASVLPERPPPPASFRCRFKKESKADASAVPGPFEGGRAIGVFARLDVGSFQLGVAAGAIAQAEFETALDRVLAIRKSGTPGAKYVLDSCLFNRAMQAAKLHDATAVHANWRACGLGDDPIALLERSRQRQLEFLDRAGYSLRTSLPLQQMVAEDTGAVFRAGDPGGNYRRILAGSRRQLNAQIDFVQGRKPYARVEAGPLRRSLHTRAKEEAPQ